MATCNRTLIVVSGLPGSCKTTVASAYVRASRAAFVRIVRIDSIEQTIVNQTSHGQPLGPVGYEIGYTLASEQLRLGTGVVAECVNPLTITRDAWLRTAERSGAMLVGVEVRCSDPKEHRQRVETRTTDIPGLTLRPGGRSRNVGTSPGIETGSLSIPHTPVPTSARLSSPTPYAKQAGDERPTLCVSGDLKRWVAGFGEGGVSTVVRLFVFDRRDVAAGLEQSSDVEPVDVVQGGDLDLFDGAPRSARFDHFGLSGLIH
jgi:predicted kinase